MKKKHLNVIFPIILLFLPVVLSASENLKEYLMIAAENNPELKAKFFEYNSALQKTDQVGTLPDPELSFGMIIMTGEPYFHDKVTEISLMQMFPWFGSLGAAKDEAVLMAKAKYEQFNETKSTLFMKIKKLWYNLYLIDREIVFTEENMTILKDIEQIAMSRFKTGVINTKGQMTGKEMIDVLRIQIEMNELESSLLFLKDRKQTLSNEFNSLLNRPLNEKILLDEGIEIAELPSSMEKINLRIRQDNFMLKTIENQMSAAIAKEKMSQKKGLPMIGLGLTYSTVLSKPDMFMPMIILSLPIWRTKYNAFVKESQLMYQSLSLKKLDVENQLIVKAETIEKKFNDAKRRKVLYDKQIFLAERSLNLLIINYSVGGSIFEEVLMMQQKLLQYRLDKIGAIIDSNIAVAEIQQLMGKLN
jgi:outer membrane protein, heavy metal efflux system